ALLFGIPFGALGDRFNRRAMLVAVNVLGTACLLGLAAVALAGRLGLTEIIVASLLLGMVDTLRGTTAQSYAYDLAGNEGATNAIALSNLGAQLVGAAGGAIGGLVLDRLGSPAAFSVAAAGSAMAASVLAGAGRDRLERGGGTRLVPGGQRSMTLILRNRPVAWIPPDYRCRRLRPRHTRPVTHPTQRGGPGARRCDGRLVLRHRIRAIWPPRDGRCRRCHRRAGSAGRQRQPASRGVSRIGADH